MALVSNVDDERHVIHFVTPHPKRTDMVKLEIIVIATPHVTEIEFVIAFFGIEFVDAVVIVVNDLHQLPDLCINLDHRDFTMSKFNNMIVFVACVEL